MFVKCHLDLPTPDKTVCSASVHETRKGLCCGKGPVVWQRGLVWQRSCVVAEVLCCGRGACAVAEGQSPGVLLDAIGVLGRCSRSRSYGQLTEQLDSKSPRDAVIFN
ncbi:unnamed protein product [Gadus morhua 'NCC']